ncbi:hypothetical protein DOTSEDRAFT_39045 [Dothistroma septosporum NZE10]|uniref:Uncharacterized protein n=1 Tax=Dothistroma septosporum (strain NZE10 / CBS 128990) TaxID=675120 RepID=M2XHB8_DOTSN|nr:hypothetical protein DOTSEDRAFT_39045 [Dothistroma septosporum NZE10]
MSGNWDLLEDAGPRLPLTKERTHSDKIRYAAALAHANNTHARVIEIIEHPDSKVLAIAAQAFQADFERVLPQGVRDVIAHTSPPYIRDGQEVRLPPFSSDKIPESYKQLFFKETKFIVDVQKLAADPSLAGKKWIEFLDFLGDANCGYIRKMAFHFENVTVQLNVRPRIFEIGHEKAGHIRAPLTCFRLESLPGESCFLKQNEADFHQASDWLRQAFQKITTDRERFLKAGRFGMRDINKVGKVVFRLPALCCWLQSQRRGKQVKDREDSGTCLALPTVPERSHSPNRVVNLPTEKELREHAVECEGCDCAWVRQADGAL